MNKNYTLEELETFLSGELSAERKTQLEESIKTEPELLKELSALQISLEAVELAGWKTIIAESQKEFISERAKIQIKPNRTSQFNIGTWIGRIAASITLLLVGALAVLFFTTSPESITSNQVGFSLPVMRSADQISSLESAYQKGDYEEVLELAKGVNSYDSRTYLLVGLANLETNLGLAAEEFLTQIEEENRRTSNLEFADQVDYYLVKAYLMQGKITEAEERIEKITEDPNHTYHSNFGRLDLIKLQILKIKN
ncbi:hypothetical protein [Algoriphagus sp. A40]|uniref:hypothetical protein n=1 Tax=Algoriphagus sp. A40 TaxID=1945863 RepID=UPI000987867B|nr:hypothetical protein [Algoriphagus sp. A40]OOG72395.1 hypothetical protein B0E43_16020 [Algoriphagus sp. A40]